MKSILLLFVCFWVLALALSSCSSSVSNIQDYNVGTIDSATVGDMMISWGSLSKRDFGDVVQGGLRMDLIYNGIDHNVLQISYREYFYDQTSTYARPAFNQEMKYDISTSNIISFRDMKIRIEKANPEQIIFTLLNPPLLSKENYNNLELTGAFLKAGFNLDNQGNILNVLKGGKADTGGLIVGDAIIEVDNEFVQRGNAISFVRNKLESSSEYIIIKVRRKESVYLLTLKK